MSLWILMYGIGLLPVIASREAVPLLPPVETIPFHVAPAKAGAQPGQMASRRYLDPRLRGDDEKR